MESRHLNLRAVIFDLYGTLLEVAAAPADAGEQWARLWQQRFATPPRLRLQEFAARCDQVIEREHSTARARGVAYPEVFWPAVVGEVVPELTRLDTDTQDEFLFQQARLRHTVRLMPGAGDVLRELSHGQVVLGLASNSQPYTLRELDETLASVGLVRRIFTGALCFLSFEHGFSKPDRRAFGWIASRLQGLEIPPAQTLVVGDRQDNDIEPARAGGFLTWHLTPFPGDGLNAGTWEQLRSELT
jgi:putative hydrolase of the HAD superfamily